MSDHTLLIANRGEIAARIMRTARLMGLRTVAVHSEADRGAPFVAEADQAVPIGPASARESYLDPERILQAARETGADLIHPGYGFLSESTGLVRRCEAEGIQFVGPGTDAIAAMGDKTAAKRLMEDAGVPLVPGYHGDDQSLDYLESEAHRIGLPLLIKASAGGGGKGMRVVREFGELRNALDGVQREASVAFGNDQVLLERFVDHPRHVEVQVLFDHHGNGRHVFDRDCSIQRRHQKILEEAPAPDLTDPTREAMANAALRCAHAIGYRNAGTVEFLLGPDGHFYFMEMNTRLQVEHPVTEAITGLDLVEWQIRIALGEPLPWPQEGLQINGHAVEARVYAEDPDHSFLPTSGRVQYLNEPVGTQGIRVDSGIAQGVTVSNHYDPMLAKVIAHGRDRQEAITRLRHALTHYHLGGFAINVGYLCRILGHDSFINRDLKTHFVDQHEADLVVPAIDGDTSVALGLLGWLWLKQPAAATTSTDPWSTFTGWRLVGEPWQRVEIHQGERHTIEYALQPVSSGWRYASLRGLSQTLTLRWQRQGHQGTVVIETLDQARRELTLKAISCSPAGVTLFAEGESWAVRVNHPEMDLTKEDSATLTAPMHGRVVALHCAAGDHATKGQPLVVMEAMKMEHTITAPAEGIVTELYCSEGDSLSSGQTLIAFEPNGDPP
ncbi:biotin carboxylase N-terminal domain-containing protein [Salicola sp. Rm-C-2C1-2]|uniref:acetyl/propionyl/methylcrotonyl-CoA carboxylase subunit alpha n=1 Tax=Salicola sp. Rm-C-2C1-2 TaxID=3141321 RepID=UPI0032E41E9C